MVYLIRRLLLITTLTVSIRPLPARQNYPPAHLDLTADVAAPLLESSTHQPLPEQYLWLRAVKAGSRDNPVYFRDAFNLAVVPRMATLYVAGPDHIRVYVNGRWLANAERDLRSRLRPLVLSSDVATDLRPGENVLAIEASHGDRLAVKIVPRDRAVEAPALVTSDGAWKGSEQAGSGWEQPGYRDDAWSPVRALGGVESKLDDLR